MSKRESGLSRASRNQHKQKENRLLNMLLIVVVLAIIITITIIIKNISNSDTVNSNRNEQQQEVVDKKSAEEVEKSDQQGLVVEEELIPPDPGTVTYLTSDDPIVLETIVDTSWEPVATEQTGEHQSSYDGTSLDWQEKKQAIAYAVGHAEENLIYKKVKNGGSSSKAIGIVSTKDKIEMFQVFIEWIDGAGWKPTKVDVLTTLDFDY